MPEPKIIEAIRANDCGEVMRLLRSNEGRGADLAEDGRTAFDLAQAVGSDAMKAVFKADAEARVLRMGWN